MGCPACAHRKERDVAVMACGRELQHVHVIVVVVVGVIIGKAIRLVTRSVARLMGSGGRLARGSARQSLMESAGRA